MRLSFSKAMETGHDAIDGEHAHIIEAFNTTVGAVAECTDVVEARGHLQAFLDLCSEHFHHEEQVLAAADYPDLTAHAACHAEMLSTARKATENFILTHDEEARRIYIDDMMCALIDDIVKSDMMFASYLQSRGYARQRF